MKNEELIQDFLDGALPDNLQKELFEKLANDRILRNDLLMEIQLSKSVLADKANYKVPADFTNSVFSELGINFPLETPKRSRKALFIIPSLVALFFLVAGGMYLAVNNLDIANKKEVIVSSESSSTNHNIPVVTSRNLSSEPNSSEKIIVRQKLEPNDISVNQNSNSSANKNYDGKNFSKSKKNKNSISESSSNKLSSNNITNIEDVKAIEESDFGINQNLEDSEQSYSYLANNLEFNDFKHSNFDNNFLTLEPKSFSENNRISKWSMLIRKLPGYSINKSALPGSNDFYANSAFGISYRVTANKSIGVECGYENFSQQFTLENGNLQYDQNPLMFWYGAFLNYSPEEIKLFGFIQPYAQLFAGGTTIGPLLKTQTGLSLNVLKNINLNIGAEYGILIYRVENNFYNSRNICGSVGLQFSF